KRIEVGNFDDDFTKVKNAEWIIEAVVERLDVKQQIFQRVDEYRKAGTLVTSNTSGIPIHSMLEGRTEDFKENFCGVHFFNPPRYLPLLEIIPTKATSTRVLEFLKKVGERNLGKTVVVCKDTPAFIGNRIGVYSMLSIAHLLEKLGLSVEEVDKYTGPAMGHPKSATFRTADVVGLDTLVNVANGLSEHLKEDESKGVFELPEYLSKMVYQQWLGEKSGQGFYKKIKDGKGKSIILSLDLNTLEYNAQSKVQSPTLEMT